MGDPETGPATFKLTGMRAWPALGNIAHRRTAALWRSDGSLVGIAAESAGFGDH